ncbi:mucin-4-like [Mizuhopecten yessoensis]|uniref:von Willebrand factor D and EGF domain-containing protein n=1 Tax=Mizuhopecten yessoensis TaxID=6573 RepID=A0A210PZQ2_MIZYE|nr:mucin-4-like [Mizuhopecten yessoensis]OWF41973.1 von Willebrand factor D and EGF domain-containing protein [Mizuhopecten yessoensis]
MGSLTTLSIYLGLTAITNAAVSSGFREHVPGITSSEICHNHTVLKDQWREIGSERGDNCDSNIHEGWYRLMTTDGHSASLPTACIKNHVCGLGVALWLDLQGEDLPQPGDTVRGFVCGAYPVLSVWQCCVVRETAFVYNCGDYFLYWLRPTDRCSVGFCGEGPRSDISPYTVKTGEPAADSSDRFRRRLRHQRHGGPASNEHPVLDGRSIRDVSTPDDLPCPEGQIRCPNRVCVESLPLCRPEEASVSPPTTEYVTRAPITFYFSVLRDRTRAPVSITSWQPSAYAQTNAEGNTMARPNSASLSNEEGTKRLFLVGETTPSIATQTPATTVKSTIQKDLSTFLSYAFRDGSSSLLDLSGDGGRGLPTPFAGTSDSDHSSTPTSYSGTQNSRFNTDYHTNQPSTLAPSTDSASKSIATSTSHTMFDTTYLSTPVTDRSDSTTGTHSHIRLDLSSELPSKTIDETGRHHVSLPIGSCSACLQPSVTSFPLMSETIITDSLSSSTLDLATPDNISTHVIRKEQMSSIISTTSSSTVIPHNTAGSLRLQPTASTTVPDSPSSTVLHQHSSTSLHASSHNTFQLSSTSTVSHAYYLTASQLALSSASHLFSSSSASKHVFSSSSSQQLTISSVSPRTTRPDISPSATLAVIPSKMTIVTSSLSPSVTKDRCTQCIEVVFKLRAAIANKQAEREFHVSIQTAFSRMLTQFHERRFYRDVRNTTYQGNRTVFLPTDIYIRNTTSSGNITVLLLEAKNPSGDFVRDDYLAFLLQKSEVRRALEQDLIAYGATLDEFSVPASPNEIPVPGAEGGVTSIFSQHFGLFLTVIIMSSFVAFVGVIAMVYLRKKARTGMWYCPSGTRYAKQLERTLLTKTTNWRVGQVTSPIPDVDILRGEGLMTETTSEEDDSRRASYTGERTSRGDSCPEVDTWVVPLGEAMDDRPSNKEYDTRL